MGVSRIDCCILNPMDLLALISFECQKLGVHLDMMTGNLLVLMFGVEFGNTSATVQPVHTIAFEYFVIGRVGGFNPVIALPIPDDAKGTQMVLRRR